MLISMHINDADLAQAESMLDRMVHCSRHALLVAALRYGLQNLSPERVPEFLEGHRWRHRVRVRPT